MTRLTHRSAAAGVAALIPLLAAGAAAVLTRSNTAVEKVLHNFRADAVAEAPAARGARPTAAQRAALRKAVPGRTVVDGLRGAFTRAGAHQTALLLLRGEPTSSDPNSTGGGRIAVINGDRVVAVQPYDAEGALVKAVDLDRDGGTARRGPLLRARHRHHVGARPRTGGQTAANPARLPGRDRGHVPRRLLDR